MVLFTQLVNYLFMYIVDKISFFSEHQNIQINLNLICFMYIVGKISFFSEHQNIKKNLNFICFI